MNNIDSPRYIVTGFWQTRNIHFIAPVLTDGDKSEGQFACDLFVDSTFTDNITDPSLKFDVIAPDDKTDGDASDYYRYCKLLIGRIISIDKLHKAPKDGIDCWGQNVTVIK